MPITPVQRGTATGAAVLASAACAPAIPAGVISRDLVVAWAVADNAATAAGFSITPGTGAAWTSVGSGQDNAGFGAGMAWWKIANGSEPASYTVGYNGTNCAAGVVAFQTGTFDPTNPFPSGSTGYSLNTVTNATLTAPSVTGINMGMLLCLYGTVGTSNATQTFTPGGSQTELLDLTTGASGVASIDICDLALAADGATATQTSVSSTARRAVTASLAISPFAPAPRRPLNRARFRAACW